MEFYEVVSKYQYADEFGNNREDDIHEAYFYNLDNAYYYCLDRYNREEEPPYLSTIEDAFYPPIETDFNIGGLTIKKLYFDDDN